jgi:hypothetical protein
MGYVKAWATSISLWLFEASSMAHIAHSPKLAKVLVSAVYNLAEKVPVGFGEGDCPSPCKSCSRASAGSRAFHIPLGYCSINK